MKSSPSVARPTNDRLDFNLNLKCEVYEYGRMIRVMQVEEDNSSAEAERPHWEAFSLRICYTFYHTND